MIFIHIHAISPDRIRRTAITRRLIEFTSRFQEYDSVEEFKGTHRAGQNADPHLVIYVPPPKPLESYEDDLISICAMSSKQIFVSVICMSTEEALTQTCDVLKIPKLLYDSKEHLKDQIRHITNHRYSPYDRTVSKSMELTAREQSVLIGLRAGLPIKEIAFNLGVSANTISTYKLRIMRKRGYLNNADLYQRKTST